MATTLYLRKSTALQPYLRAWRNKLASTVLGTQIDKTGSSVGRYLSTTAGNAASSVEDFTTTTGLVAFPGINSSQSIMFVTDPIAAQVTISGTIAYDIWALETSMSANATVVAALFVIHPDATASLISSASYGTELGTSQVQASFSDSAPTSTTLNPGDVLALCLWVDDAGTTTMGSGYTVTVNGNGAEGTAGDSQVRLTETLTFASVPTGTVLFPSGDASDVSGTVNKRAWTDQYPTAQDTVTISQAGYAETQLTDTAGGNALSWFTPQLEAVTIEGRFDVSVFFSGPTAGNVSSALRVFKTDADGSNPVQIGNAVCAQRIDVNVVFDWYGHISGVLTNGQRLKFVFYLVPFIVSSIPGYNLGVYFGNASYKSKLTFPVTLTEYNATPPTIPTDYWGVAA
jgi:hypothetical protein